MTSDLSWWLSKRCQKRRFKPQCEALEGQAEDSVAVLAGSAAEVSPQSGENPLGKNQNCSLPKKRGLPEKRAGVRPGRPDQSLGFKNFHPGFKNFQPGKEGEKKRDNHLVKKSSVLAAAAI